MDTDAPTTDRTALLEGVAAATRNLVDETRWQSMYNIYPPTIIRDDLVAAREALAALDAPPA